MAAVAAPGLRVTPTAVRFVLPDPERRLRAVRLLQEIARPRNEPAFARWGKVWQATLERPPVDRLEYAFEVTHGDGGVETICDPSNGRRAAGAFGDKSVVEFREYRAPAWVAAGEDQPLGGEALAVDVPLAAIGVTLPVLVWTSRGRDPEEPLPLLVAHDGPELAEYGRLLHLLDACTRDGRLPPLRVALVRPADRNEIYSASARYVRALSTELLPLLDWLAPRPEQGRTRVALGASLGALALLHAHRTRPNTFDGLFLQSGSYFRQRYDRHESDFPRFRRISRFLGEVLHAESFSDPVPVRMTCGTVEENLANNRAVCAALERQGYDVSLHVHRDAHNWISWRDTWDPHLVDFLASCWAA
jgi:enterochelin esterase-like enzyme